MDHDISKIISQIKDGETDKWGAAEISELLKKLGLDECLKPLSKIKSFYVDFLKISGGVDSEEFLKIDDFKSLGIPSKYIDQLKDSFKNIFMIFLIIF